MLIKITHIKTKDCNASLPKDLRKTKTKNHPTISEEKKPRNPQEAFLNLQGK